MSSASQFFGGGGQITRFERVFLTSGTFNAPIAGKYLVTAIGGGGAGGGRGTTAAQVGGGGAAGGFSQRLVTLAANDAITYTVGAFGVGASNAIGGTGGTTTISVAGYTLTANGGAGGPANLTADGTPAAGGTASGGTINVTGGSGSSIYIASYGGGGGAVGIYGIGHSAHVAGNTGAGAGVGGQPSGVWPGTALMTGADLIALFGSAAPTTGADFSITDGRSIMFETAISGASIGTSVPTCIGGYNTPSGRFLEPRGGITYNQGTASNARYLAGPGCGGWRSASALYAGAFAGAGGANALAGTTGGIGGGGGSGAGGGDTTARAGGNGGMGLVVIEWFAAI